MGQLNIKTGPGIITGQQNLNSVNEQSDDVLSDVSGGPGRRSKNRLLGKKKRKKGQK